MAEAIGVASSVLAFALAAIKLTVQIVELINGVKEAPQTLADLHDSLQILRIVLEKLAKNEQQVQQASAQKSVTGNTQDANKGSDQATMAAVKQCNKVLKRISDVLGPMQEKLQKGKFQASWVMFYTGAMEKSIKEHFDQLERAKSGLILALTFDIRFAVSNGQGQTGSGAGPSTTQNPGQAPPNYSLVDPDPTASIQRQDSARIEPTPGIKRQDSAASFSRKASFKRQDSFGFGRTGSFKRQDSFGLDRIGSFRRQNSELARATLRGKALISKLIPNRRETFVEESVRDPQSINFSELISTTIDDVSKSVNTSGKGPVSEDHNMAMFQMLWRADFDKIQSLWGLNPEAVQHLKGVINDLMCDIFIASLKASPATMKEIGDAAEDTLQWIDHNVEYRQWLQSESSELLLVEGKAGSGKSVLTKTVWNKISNVSDDEALLSYFCNYRMRPSEACPSILRAYICQYLRENKGEFTELVQRCGSLKHDWDSSKVGKFDFSFDILLDTFQTVLEITKKKRIYCIIDAMDECSRDEDMEKFIGFLKRNKLAQNHPDTTVKFFISTRPDWIMDIGYLLLANSPLKIVLRPELTNHDIAQVIEQELGKIQKRLPMDPEEKATLKANLIAKAEGMILWVVLAFRDIARKISKRLGLTLKFIKDIVEKLPREIFGMYDHIMANIKKRWDQPEEEEEEETEEKEEESNLSLLRRLILWVARAGRPLTVKELQHALAIDMGDTCFEDTKGRFISNLEDVIGRIPFLEIVSEAELYEKHARDEDTEIMVFKMPEHAMTPTTTVRFIHQTAKEYILQIADSSNPPGTGKEATDPGWPSLDDLRLGNLCVKFLSFKDFESGPIRGFPDGIRFRDGFKAYIESWGFLEYAASFWFWHLNRLPELDDDTKNFVSIFCCDLEENLRLWCQLANFILLGEHTDLEEDFFGLHVSASLGMDHMTRYFIDRGDDINKRDEWGRTPYMMADWGCFESTKRVLEDAGADTNLEAPNLFSCDLSAFHSAVMSKDTKEIQKAIGEGVDINEVDSFGRSALFYAASNADADIINLLLKANANVEITDKHGRLPIDVTLDPDCRKLILDRMNETGSRCSVETHDPRPRVRAGFLTSWIDYTPHLKTLHIENPIKELEKTRKNLLPTASRGSVAKLAEPEPVGEPETIEVKEESQSAKMVEAKVIRTQVVTQDERQKDGCGCTIL
ncbi:hypothetical protein AA313_de0200504 [Arthrobotrys entomopaga]|nr:hypothetical protein AA313_de0200504 [Arthrobotrys entomopaga]